jgi:hypothetical protein
MSLLDKPLRLESFGRCGCGQEIDERLAGGIVVSSLLKPDSETPCSDSVRVSRLTQYALSHASVDEVLQFNGFLCLPVTRAIGHCLAAGVTAKKIHVVGGARKPRVSLDYLLEGHRRFHDSAGAVCCYRQAAAIFVPSVPKNF